MPEAFAILAVFFAVVAVYIYARVEAKNPALQNASQDLARLQHHAARLQDRLRRAQRENWDSQMVASLAAELETTKRQLTQAVGQTHTPAIQSH